MIRRSVDLPDPLGPNSGEGAAFDLERDVVERGDSPNRLETFLAMMDMSGGFLPWFHDRHGDEDDNRHRCKHQRDPEAVGV